MYQASFRDIPTRAYEKRHRKHELVWSNQYWDKQECNSGEPLVTFRACPRARRRPSSSFRYAAVHAVLSLAYLACSYSARGRVDWQRHQRRPRGRGGCSTPTGDRSAPLWAGTGALRRLHCNPWILSGRVVSDGGLKKTAPLSHPIMPYVGGDGSSRKQVREVTAAERR